MTARRVAGAVLFFAAVTAVMTWPQARRMRDAAAAHQDVYFNMWRLEWVAHALATNPRHLFDANIFAPEPRTLTYSDAMLVEGAIAAPLIYAGTPPVLVHNLLLLGAIAACGLGMFVLVRYLTESAAAGLIAGVVFCFAPYRFEHYMHMELQWAMWMPLAFWALHRTLDTGDLRFGLATGAFVALQMLSSIYYGLLLATLLPAAGVLLFLADRSAPAWRAGRALGAGVVAAAMVCGAYAVPYLRTHAELGGRPVEELSRFSARPSNYLIATPDNRLYGGRIARRSPPERRLFPGLVVVTLALAGLFARRAPKRQIVYLLALAGAFDLSLGLGGVTYSFLYDHAGVFRSLRALARAAIFVLMFLAVLAGYGYAAIEEGRSRAARAAIFVAVLAALLVEYAVKPLELVVYPNTPSAVYEFLRTEPRGVVAEFPLPETNALPGPDAAYSYASTFHWFPLVNGYSGFFPPSYIDRLDRLAGFPDSRSLIRLRRDNVRYVIVHSAGMTPEAFKALIDAVTNSGAFNELGRFPDAEGEAIIFKMR
jgi:hypothetical protein